MHSALNRLVFMRSNIHDALFNVIYVIFLRYEHLSTLLYFFFIQIARSRELGKLDPTLYLSEMSEELYDVPMDHLGRVWFSISYDETTEQLRVTIHKARNLRPPRYQSLRASASTGTSGNVGDGLNSTQDITAFSLLSPVPTQDSRVRSVSGIHLC